ncbi:hypothetical protein ACTWJ8_39815 (plasmid) [Streptomyces sp. SDT5-1]|uniref:hypothetical protein n=1 Tax=Streptomyces sp. SDT5-1 TaxID=3406418 RepID=UPI003FD321C5
MRTRRITHAYALTLTTPDRSGGRRFEPVGTVAEAADAAAEVLRLDPRARDGEPERVAEILANSRIGTLVIHLSSRLSAQITWAGTLTPLPDAPPKVSAPRAVEYTGPGATATMWSVTAHGVPDLKTHYLRWDADGHHTLLDRLTLTPSGVVRADPTRVQHRAGETYAHTTYGRPPLPHTLVHKRLLAPDADTARLILP